MLFALCLFPAIVSGQCKLEQDFFSVNERLNYDVYFNWKFVWVKAANAEMKSQSTAYKGTAAYKTLLTGKTKGVIDNVYRVNDTLMCYVSSANLAPLFYSKAAHEGKSYSAYEEITYSYPGNPTVKARLQDWRNKKFKSDTVLTSQKCFYDALSQFYFIRSLIPENMAVTKSITIPILFTDESFDVKVAYKGTETVEIDKEKINTVKYSLSIDGEAFANKKESVFVWLSLDENRIPVMIESKLKVGSIKALLKKASGCRNPYEAFPDDSKIVK